MKIDNKTPVAAIIMGSDSDWTVVSKAHDIFKELGIPDEVRVISAHRSPDIACEYASSAGERGIKVIIAAAGGAAHLAGVIAGHTTLPVIGIPVQGGALNGLDALLATVQMPSGVPVAAVTLGSAGAANAALLAAEILALGDPGLSQKLKKRKENLRAKVIAADERIRQSIESEDAG